LLFLLRNFRYLLNTNGLNVQLKKNSFSYDVYEMKKIGLTRKDRMFYDSMDKNGGKQNTLPDYSLEQMFHRVDVEFEGSSADVKLVPTEKSKDYDNYYTLKHAPEGILMIHKFQKVTYKNLYPNIDVVFFLPEDKSKAVEYNFIIHPGGKISDIKMKFNGLKTDLADSKIKMETRFGIMEETLPMSWTEDGITKEEVAVGYKKIKKNVYGFDFEESQVSGKTIIIDPVPVRLWGTYYGASSSYSQLGLENDHSSNIYLCGGTFDTSNIATSGSFMSTKSAFMDAYVVKFDSNGNRIWGTYYGGNNNDWFNSVSYFNNEIILTGTTRSSNNISTSGAFKEFLTTGGFAQSDVFITKFDVSGFRVWGTYYGGEHDDRCSKSIVDATGHIIIVGGTYSINNIATLGAFKDTKNVPIDYHTTPEGFITKFNNSGFQIWGSYYYLCQINGLDFDSNSNIFFSGDVSNGTDNFTTTGTHQSEFQFNQGTGISNNDSFIIKFNPFGQRIWGTYYGNAWENNYCLKVDNSDDILISGATRSTVLISTPGSHQPDLNLNVQNPSDAYLAKFDQNGQLIWGTYYGGDGHEDSNYTTIDIDESNNIFLAGNTRSTNNIATLDAYNYVTNGWYESYIVKFNSIGTRIWGTYYGGSNGDFSTVIKYDKQGSFYLAGRTFSANNIISVDGHQQNLNLNGSNFLVKFKDCLSSIIVSSNSPVCVGSTVELVATGGTTYSWTGPNGFTSPLANPTIPLASALNSGTYFCAISGTDTCDDTLSVAVSVGDTTAPVADVATLPTITGDCNTLVVLIPTSTDACLGIIPATTESPLIYSQVGTYTIVWNYTDGTNISTQNQTVVISAQPLPTALTPQVFCKQYNATLNEIVVTGQNIKWYDAATGGNLLVDTTSLINGTTYYVSKTIDGCESERIPISATIYETPAPSGIMVQTFCDTQILTLADFVVAGTDIVFYDAAVGGNLWLLPATLVHNQTYYASQTLNGCESISRLALIPDIINSVPANDYADLMCDDLDDGLEVVDLSDYNAALIANPAAYTFKYYMTFTAAQNETAGGAIANFSSVTLATGLNTIYVRVMFANSCFKVVPLVLTVIPLPKLNMKDTHAICENGFVTLTADAGFDSYSWSNGANTRSITVTQGGDYAVTVTKNNGTLVCSSTKNSTVEVSERATITAVETIDWTTSENAITVFVDGSGTYEYSVDGINFQSSNHFFGLPNGAYTIYVNDTKGCGVSKKDVYLLMYPKFFTPNGDSYNDFWGIQFYQNEVNLVVKIFDRYGKFIRQLSATDPFWNGTYNGQPLPASDYWFTVIRENGKEFTGHFSLKR
jgi:gliding motility-associated-like protein